MKRYFSILLFIVFMSSAVFGAPFKKNINMKLGPGFMIGSPMSLSAKFVYDETHMAELGIGDAEGEGFYLYGDYNYKIYSFPKLKALSVLAGAGIGYHRYEKNRRGGEIEENRAEIRVPVGVEYLFEEVPVGLCIQFVPSLQMNHGVAFHFRGGVGARYYFRI